MHLAGISNRAGDDPIIFQSLGSFSLGSVGTGNVLATCANSPYRACLPDVCVTTLCAARHSDAGTFHCFAAAAINISRAAAPALRT